MKTKMTGRQEFRDGIVNIHKNDKVIKVTEAWVVKVLTLETSRPQS